MQNKSAVWIFTILLVLACLYQLSFTWITSSVENDAKSVAQEKVDSLRTEVGSLSLFEEDSARQSFEDNYLANMSSKEVYPVFGFNYNYCKKQRINLGLDLQGGMHVTLEVSVPDMINALAGSNKEDAQFKAIMTRAREMQKSSSESFVTLFGIAHQEVTADYPLANIFHTLENKDKIAPEATDAEILSIMALEAEDAISRAEQVLRKRIDNLGVVQPKIQRQSGTGRIVVELPGVKDKKRVRKILQGTAKLEFFETYFNEEVANGLIEANQILAATNKAEDASAEETEEAALEPAEDAEPMADALPEDDSTEMAMDTSSADTSASDELADLFENDSTIADSELDLEEQRRQNPLWAVFQPNISETGFGRGPLLGYASDADTSQVNEYLNRKDIRSMFPPRTKFMWDAYALKGTENIFGLYAIKAPKGGKAPIEGDVITDARVGTDPLGNPTVNMSMNSTGAKKWREMTRKASSERDNNGQGVQRSVAVVLDNLVYSAPSVNGEIPGGRTEITGSFSQQDAADLAGVLKAGKLPARTIIIEEAVVGPSLGQESVDSGLMSFIIALVVVLAYMIFYYSKAGGVANVALVANVFFVIGVLASFHATLTLPGIAGIVLTIGMSVDANVLIYERIREELRAGKGLKLAIEDGYSNALSSILDANVTTLLTGIILFVFGSGPIQGFATTLIIGIVTSLFSAIFVTRLLFEYMMDAKKAISFSTKLTEGAFKNISIDFIGNRKKYYVISGIFILVSFGSLLTRGLNYGVDFTGGRSYIVRFEEPVNVVELTGAIADQFVNEAGEKVTPEVKTYGSSNQVKITTKYLYNESGENVENMIEGKLFAAVQPFYTNGIEESTFLDELSSQKVDPTIADDIKEGAVFAIIFSLLVIFLYIWVRFSKWQFSTGAVIAMAHDVLIVLGMFSLLYGFLPFALEIDQAFIAAILTVVGYSINDTVVVFDRIREFLNLHPKHNLKQNVNEALNSTLSRTVNTSLSTFVVLLVIFLFGGEVIRGFVFALMIGVIVGTYSSLCVATPAMYDLTLKGKKK